MESRLQPTSSKTNGGIAFNSIFRTMNGSTAGHRCVEQHETGTRGLTWNKRQLQWPNTIILCCRGRARGGREDGHKPVSKMLHDSAPKGESKDKGYSQAPLLRAAGNGHATVVKALLGHDAGMESKDRDGRTSLWWGIRHGDKTIVKALLDKGANFESRDTIAKHYYPGQQ
ncbi:ankyrin repeat protein [Colletotrichum incanum]|uniref:Ankyrin repeat protein n=1 Tax=Colletotrichum incanum TaxID=1573173 RepID=A0A167A813_COLIC|nr:ankyrin repeat protein [Colletotrichum incanum]